MVFFSRYPICFALRLLALSWQRSRHSFARPFAHQELRMRLGSGLEPNRDFNQIICQKKTTTGNKQTNKKERGEIPPNRTGEEEDRAVGKEGGMVQKKCQVQSELGIFVVVVLSEQLVVVLVAPSFICGPKNVQFLRDIHFSFLDCKFASYYNEAGPPFFFLFYFPLFIYFFHFLRLAKRQTCFVSLI